MNSNKSVDTDVIYGTITISMNSVGLLCINSSVSSKFREPLFPLALVMKALSDIICFNNVNLFFEVSTISAGVIRFPFPVVLFERGSE